MPRSCECCCRRAANPSPSLSSKQQPSGLFSPLPIPAFFVSFRLVSCRWRRRCRFPVTRARVIARSLKCARGAQNTCWRRVHIRKNRDARDFTRRERDSNNLARDENRSSPAPPLSLSHTHTHTLLANYSAVRVRDSRFARTDERMADEYSSLILIIAPPESRCVHDAFAMRGPRGVKRVALSRPVNRRTLCTCAMRRAVSRVQKPLSRARANKAKTDCPWKI